MIRGLALALCAAPTLGWAAECDPVAAPVVELTHGSRYQDDSATRSDFDEEANAEVDAALAPIDTFIEDLARQTGRALEAATDDPDKARFQADCVLTAIATWAGAEALSDLGTLNARLSSPSRIGGIAFAWALARPLATPDPAREAAISGWMTRRATDVMATFDDADTPPRSARNNLRAWGSLAVLRIGLTTGDAASVAWADAGLREMLCTANPDGSLPLEMERGPLAVHYQLHALTPLVLGSALLKDAPPVVDSLPDATGAEDPAPRPPLATACDGALARVVTFTRAAVEDPGLAEPLAGAVQDIEPGMDRLKSYERAWIPAWQSLGLAPDLSGFLEEDAPLSNSKIGGNQRRIY